MPVSERGSTGDAVIVKSKDVLILVPEVLRV